MKVPCPSCHTVPRDPPCNVCGGFGYYDDKQTIGPLDPEMGLSLLFGAIVAGLSYNNGSTPSEALVLMAVVTVLIKLTLAKLLLVTLRIGVRIAFIVGMLYLLGQCVQSYG